MRNRVFLQQTLPIQFGRRSCINSVAVAALAEYVGFSAVMSCATSAGQVSKVMTNINFPGKPAVSLFALQDVRSWWLENRWEIGTCCLLGVSTVTFQ